MIDLSSFLQEIKLADFKDKAALLDGLRISLERNPGLLTDANREAVLSYIFGEIKPLKEAILSESSFRKKYVIFSCHHSIMYILRMAAKDIHSVPENKIREIDDLTALIVKESVVQQSVSRVFEQETILDENISEIILLVNTREDEYERGVFFHELLENKDKLSKLSKSARQMLSDYTSKEFTRFLQMESWSEDCSVALEVAADVVSCYGDEQALSLLSEITGRNHLSINYYALQTFLVRKCPVPEALVINLSNDLAFAYKTYHILKDCGKESLFPKELQNEIYLAKSHMVDWLLYPTELNQKPDEIEYVGKIKYLFKKDVYHVFKFRSDSDTLPDESKNTWLLGWANDDGGTFSHFDLYDNFDKGTIEKTLKNIKRKVIGR